MKASERTLQQLLHSADQYVIPVFQRYYTWGPKEWERLWEDVEPLLEDGESQRRHFLGSIVCVPERHQPGVVPGYQVIDGQQRLTTLSVLLCAVRDLAKLAQADELASEVMESYLVHKFKKDRERYKVYLRQRDRVAYLSLIDRATPDGSRVGEAYRYFSKKFGGIGSDSEARLRSVFSAVTSRLDIVAITLDGENPYKIFRSLNSTGVDLEEGDLIRNHVFMALPVDEQDRFDDEHWRPLEAHFNREGNLDGRGLTAFFRDVLLRAGRYIGQNATYEAFQRVHPLSSLKPLELLPALARSAGLYDIIEGRKRHPKDAVDAAVGAIRSLNASTTYPLQLWLLSAWQERTLDDAALIRCLQMISSFVLRRYICGESSRAYSRWFCVVCSELAVAPEARLRAFLEGKGWPEDDRFTEAFVKLDLYQTTYCRAVLEGLELSQQRASERVATDRCSIEHVMPQTINDDSDGRAWQEMLGAGWQAVHGAWLHTPGNLTLVGHDYNSSMKNRPFATKKPVLSTSKVYLNKYFSAISIQQWGAEEIGARARELARLAVVTWPRPVAAVAESVAS